MSEFEFDPTAATRIEQVVRLYPLSLKDCADLLEIIAPLVDILSADGARNFLQEIVAKRYNEYEERMGRPTNAN